MSERVGVVGSRDLPPLDLVEEFLTWLLGAHPDSVVVSGGAKGVDRFAERFWVEHGGKVESYRVGRDRRYSDGGVFLIEKWHLGPGENRIEHLHHPHPHFSDYTSGLWYRSMLIAEVCDRLVAFARRGGSTGTRFTVDCARGEGKQVYEVTP